MPTLGFATFADRKQASVDFIFDRANRIPEILNFLVEEICKRSLRLSPRFLSSTVSATN